MKKTLLVIALLCTILFPSCTENDEIIYPEAPQVVATDDDENDENGTKGGN